MMSSAIGWRSSRPVPLAPNAELRMHLRPNVSRNFDATPSKGSVVRTPSVPSLHPSSDPPGPIRVGLAEAARVSA
jgi:hypothetical protein